MLAGIEMQDNLVRVIVTVYYLNFPSGPGQTFVVV